MFKKIKHVIVHTVAAGFIASILIAPNVTYADATPAVLGKTIGEWSASWWQWAFSIPASSNPILDETGAFCNEAQEGPTWFLAGTFSPMAVERHCTIPRGKYILFPIANAFWINSALDDPNNTEADYRQYASDFLPPSIGGDLEATINGNPIIFNSRTPIIRSQSKVFTAKFPADNIFEMDPNLLTGYPIVSDGFWVMLPPLKPGMHVLHFRAAQSQNVTYYLTVLESKEH